MSTVGSRGSGTPAVTNTTWSNLANVVDGAYGTDPGTIGSWVNAVANAVGTIEISGYNFSAIGAGDTLNSVTIKIRQAATQNSSLSTIFIQPFDGATAIGTPTAVSISGSVHYDNIVFPVTLAQLKSANFKVKVTITRGNNTTSTSWNLDHVDVLADYTVTTGISLALPTATLTLLPGTVSRTVGTVSLPLSTATAILTPGVLSISVAGAQSIPLGTAVLILTGGTLSRTIGGINLPILPASITLMPGILDRVIKLPLPTATLILLPGTVGLVFIIVGAPYVWNGTTWVPKPMKVWNGSTWVVKPVKVWNGTAWVLA